MATTAGALSKVSVGITTASVLSAAATAGSAPYTYQWYRSTTTGFTPGGGNIISGATSLSLDDSGLTGGTVYYYKVIALDSGATAGTSSQLAVATSALAQAQDQFSQSAVVGMADQRFNYNTKAVIIDSTETASLVAGQAVKMVSSSSGVMHVVKCAADTDECLGFIAYNIKNKIFVAGDAAEIFQDGNVMYLQATSSISAGAQVALDVTSVGGVQAVTGSSSKKIVGWAMESVVGGQLVRINLKTPSFRVDA